VERDHGKGLEGKRPADGGERRGGDAEARSSECGEAGRGTERAAGAEVPLLVAIRNDVAGRLAEAVERARAEGELSVECPVAVEVEEPRERGHGDIASNVALVTASRAGAPPRLVAQAILECADWSGSYVSDVEVAGPGFINITLDRRWLRDALAQILRLGTRYGRCADGGGRRVQVEFVSANPTGPMTAVQGRAGAVGDVLASLLEWTGHDVEREFYVNDAGRQVRLLGESVDARCRELLGREAEIPEEGYPGEYLIPISREIVSSVEGYLDLPTEERVALCADRAVEAITAMQRRTLLEYGVEFDVWFSERTLHEGGEVRDTVDELRRSGYVREEDGALWFTATRFGDDKDRVLVRSDGEPTYLAGDAAYHRNKYRRGFDLVINLWGPDHHGYVERMKAVVEALGRSRDDLEVLIVQLVRLLRGGEVVRMSKRGGDIVTLDEVIEEVGSDAARFFFLLRSADAHLDFDLDLATLESEENPVYYVQYAHARLCSLFAKARERGVELPEPGGFDASLLEDESEEELIRLMARFPLEVLEAAEAREPHRMTRYARDLASAFHAFYTRCRILGEEPALEGARLALAAAARQVLRNVLSILGVSAPERM